jgi:beta-glucosidase
MKDQNYEQAITNLLEQMSISEKVSLLSGRNNWFTMAIDRLKIPSIVMTDGPHGVRTGGAGNDRIVSKATAYPTGISMASTWNRELIERVGIAIAEETRHLGCHILLGPCVNIVRSPLGGRNFETFAEDPYLAGQIGVAYVRGLQSQGIGASVKHFVANNQEYERHRGNSVVDERTLREIYLPAFETIVKEMSPWTVMCAYNRINGAYASAHEILLRRFLKEEWGFEGVVVSDWGAVHDIHEPVTAGLDLEMPGPARYFGQALEAAVDNWQVEERHLDDAARRMLRMIFRTGVMTDQTLPEGSGDTPEHRSAARELAAESMVLLKNDNQRLPLQLNQIKKLAVIGMNANREISGGGSSRVDAHHWVTPLAGLQEKIGNQVEVEFALGYDNRVDPILVEAERFTHGDRDQPGLDAFYYNNLDQSGEPVLTRLEPDLGDWWGGVSPEVGVIDRNCFSARWTGAFTAAMSGETHFYVFNTGTAKVWLDGKLILENEVGTVTSAGIDRDRMAAKTSVNLEKGKQYSFKAEFISGEMSQFAIMQLLYMPPLGVDGDLLEEAVTLAATSDAALVVVGLPDLYETEGHDRPDMALPGDQAALVKAIVKANPNTIVAVNAGAPVAMPWADDVDAILLTYYPGQEGGHALADILVGDVTPSGKLTVSWPKRLADNPAFIHYPGWKDVHYGEGLFVGYRYYDAKDVDPLFPFGHGLSYTTFAYSGLNLPKEAHAGEEIEVTLSVENTGEVPGQEIVQLYIRDIDSTLIRPVKELRGFEKVMLKPGESKTLTFKLNTRSLSYYDPHQQAWVAEAGEFEVLVGSSSRDIRLCGVFELSD